MGKMKYDADVCRGGTVGFAMAFLSLAKVVQSVP